MQSICILKKNIFPANLNALIRYKTINKCLSNPYREWSISDLIEACSSALEENRGIYTGVSERTIREDIRVMRSDILGFNAPISQKNGNYFYEDRSYSIFNVSIKDSALLSRVLKFIRELQAEMDHPEMDEIISSIGLALDEHKTSSGLTPEFPSPGEDAVSSRTLRERIVPLNTDDEIEEQNDLQEPDIQDFQMSEADDGLKWSRILNLIAIT